MNKEQDMEIEQDIESIIISRLNNIDKLISTLKSKLSLVVCDKISQSTSGSLEAPSTLERRLDKIIYELETLKDDIRL